MASNTKWLWPANLSSQLFWAYQNTDKETFCCGMLDLPCPAEDIGISYSVFGALFDIAEKYATNRNNAILEMVRKITTLSDINIKSTVRKYQKKQQPCSRWLLGRAVIILPPQPNKFPFLDEAASLKVGQLKVVSEFFLTNGVMFDLSLNREKFNLNWETITSFINDYFKLEGNDPVLLQSLVSSCNSIKKKVSAFGKNKNFNEKQDFLQQIFIPPTKLKKNIQEEFMPRKSWFW